MSLNAMAEAVRQGKAVLCGNGTFLAGGTLAVLTEFATVDSVVATINKATAPTTRAITFDVSGATVTLRGWKATAAGDTTLIASDATEDVYYTIIGRLR